MLLDLSGLRLDLRDFQASGSDRHPSDIAMMLQVSGDLVDPAVLETWSIRQGVAEVLDHARGIDSDPD